MALSLEEKNLVSELKEKGYSNTQIIGHIGSTRRGMTSAISDELGQTPDKEVLKDLSYGQKPTPLINRFTDAIGMGGATDTFGNLLARQGVGPQTKAQGQEFVEKPTALQTAGAIGQTATVPAGFVLTGGTSLLGQVAAGAGLGYLYDVGSDFAEGETGASAFKPGAETLVGAAFPPALRGLGAVARPIGKLLGRGGKTVSEGAQQGRKAVTSVVDSLRNADVNSSGLVQRAKEFTQRVPRAVRRVSENLDEGAEIAKRKQVGSPQVVQALDEGVPVETIDFVQEFDQPTRNAAQEMFDLAEGGRGTPLPQTVPGRIAGEQLEIARNQRKVIGEKIGEFSDSLPTQAVDASPSLNNLRTVLSQNGLDAVGDRISFDNVSLTPKQENLVNEMYQLATKRAQLSPRQIHQMDQLFSKLQREARYEGIADVFVKVPTADGNVTEKNIYKVFRDVFSQQLDEVAEQMGRSDIRELNREYRTLRNLQDNVEATIVRQSKREGISVDPSESASVALRRLFSTATSRAEYQEIYDQLDAVSRALGFEGPRADTLMEFYLEDMKRLYPDTVPKASFEGGIRGAVSGVIDTITQVGAPNVKDQRKALQGLLQSADTPPSSSFKQPATAQTTNLVEEAKKYFADPRSIPKTENEFIQAHTLYHGANTKFADQLEKTKTFKPGAKREAGTGGNFYGLSATTDFPMAKDFSTSVTGEGRVVELYIDPKAKVLNMKGKALDDLTEAETRKLAQEYDVIRDIDNVGGESEVRILNPDILRDRSQIESAWVLQDTGITDLYKD